MSLCRATASRRGSVRGGVASSIGPAALGAILLVSGGLGCTNKLEASSSGAGTGGSGAGAVSGVGGSAGSSSGGSGVGGSGAGLGVSEEFVRLTRAEYRATLAAATGLEPSVDLLPEDGRIGVFTSNAAVTPDPVHPYMLAGEDLATLLIPDLLPSCNDSTCIEGEYRPVLESLYRRPLTDAELTTLSQMHSGLVSQGVAALDASRALMATALLSPDFLYRSSPSNAGQAAATRRLAERISYALWDAPPDAELQAAASGAAGQVAPALEAQAARLARGPLANPILARFLGQWLHVDTDLRLEDPDFESSPEFAELLALVENSMQNDMPVTALVGGTEGFVHQDNFDAYGIPDPGTGTSDVVAIEWPPESARRGLLAQELIAGSTRHPDLSRRVIFRGLMVRRSLLCDSIPAPSPDLIELAGEVSDRTTDVRCQGCHQLIDPVGQAFAAYDLDLAGEAPAAEVISHPELEGSYTSAGELLSAVAESRAFSECFARHWLSFFLETPLRSVDASWSDALADSIQAGASLGAVVEQTVRELAARSEVNTPWCEGE